MYPNVADVRFSLHDRLMTLGEGEIVGREQHLTLHSFLDWTGDLLIPVLISLKAASGLLYQNFDQWLPRIPTEIKKNTHGVDAFKSFIIYLILLTI